jgi:hypothetical protein
VWEDGGLEVVECFIDSDAVVGEGREDGRVCEVSCYGQGIGGDGSAVLFNEVGKKV